MVSCGCMIVIWCFLGVFGGFVLFRVFFLVCFLSFCVLAVVTWLSFGFYALIGYLGFLCFVGWRNAWVLGFGVAVLLAFLGFGFSGVCFCGLQGLVFGVLCYWYVLLELLVGFGVGCYNAKFCFGSFDWCCCFGVWVWFVLCFCLFLRL